jgi:antibiotic biosynthesis monooxygenase (ABM) superfamily enzyme
MWLGIFPLAYVYAELLLWILPPHTPLVLRIAGITALVAPSMTYVVAPWLTRLFGGWLSAGSRQPP